MPDRSPAVGLLPPARVDVALLRDLSGLLSEEVDAEIERLRRDAHLLDSMHTFYGPRRDRAPGDLLRASLTEFSAILEVL